MENSNKNLTTLIRDIVFYYIKNYYNKHLNDNKITKIKDDDVIKFVDNLYQTRNKLLKDYIRKSLKENLKERYEKLVVENILMEMFEDIEYCKVRMIDEIKLYQYQVDDSSKVPSS